MSSNVQIVSSKAAKVGKFFSSTKWLFSWEVLVGRQLLNFEFTDSHVSGKKRLFVNKIQVLEKTSKAKDFRVGIKFENNNFLVFSEGDIFRLKANDSIVSPKPTTVLEASSTTNPLLANSELVQTFDFKEDQGSIHLTNTTNRNFNKPPPSLLNGNKKDHFISEPIHAKPPTKPVPNFEILNDSDDYYDYDYNFLAIKEQNENLEMLKYVNNIK